MLRPPVRITKPSILPVSLEDAERACRLESGQSSAALQLEIEAATDRLDGYRGTLGRALINQTWRRDYAPDCRNLYRLPFPDVSEASAAIVAPDGASTPVATLLDEDTISPFVRLTGRVSVRGGMVLRVIFTAGYGPTREHVPAAIRQAILLDVSHRFQSMTEDGRIRSETVDGVATTAFNSPEQMGIANGRLIADLLKPFRRGNLP